MQDRYTYRVSWSANDDEYVAVCLEFPSLSWLATTPEEALAGIREVVRDVVEDMRSGDEEPPVPLGLRDYSGKFMVRIPPETHRELAIAAADSGISLNRYVTARLS